MEIKDCYGKTFKFYGVHDTTFKIGKYVFEAVEDPDDGYRSYLKCVRRVNDENLVFLRRSFAQVEVIDVTDQFFAGFILRDVDTGHTWVRIGTNSVDDYYPLFTFEYQTPQQSMLGMKERKIRDSIKGSWFRAYDLHDMFSEARKAIDAGDYDNAERMLKKLKRKVDKRNKLH